MHTKSINYLTLVLAGVLWISALIAIFPHPAVGFAGQAASPESAAKALYSARLKNNRTAASKVATPGVVKKLFSGGAGGWEFMGCEKEQKSNWRCSYYYEGGGVSMMVAKQGKAYRVIGLSYIAD